VSRIVVIGVGNAYRGDDAAGLAVIDGLRQVDPGEVELVAYEQEPSRLIDTWTGADAAIVVDAAGPDGEPGRVHRFDCATTGIPAALFRSSTHAFGVGDAVEISRALGTLPRRVLVYGIEGADFESGVGMTPPVAAACKRVVEDILADLEEARCTSRP
jgi:hydrogenase maturation protease